MASKTSVSFALPDYLKQDVTQETLRGKEQAMQRHLAGIMSKEDLTQNQQSGAMLTQYSRFNADGAQKNFDLAKTNNQERTFPINLALRQQLQQQNQTGQTRRGPVKQAILMHNQSISDRSATSIQNKANPLSERQRPQNTLLAREKMWYLEEAVYRVKHSNTQLNSPNGFLQQQEKAVSQTVAQFIQDDSREQMIRAVQSIGEQISNKDHRLGYSNEEQNKKSKGHQRQVQLPTVLRKQSKDTIGDADKKSLPVPPEVPDRRIYLPGNPNYYYINKSDLETNQTYRVNVMNTQQRGKYKAYFSTVRVGGEEKFKRKFFTDQPISSQIGGKTGQRVRDLSKESEPIASVFSQKTAYGCISFRNALQEDEDHGGRGGNILMNGHWRTKMPLKKPVYVQATSVLTPPLDNPSHQPSISPSKDCDVSIVSNQFVGGGHDMSQASLNQASQKSLPLEELPSYIVKKRAHEHLISWQQRELDRELRERHQVELAVRDYLSRLKEDTDNAKDHVDKVFPNKHKQVKMSFSQRRFKLDKALTKKVLAIRRGQGWDPKPLMQLPRQPESPSLKRSMTKLTPGQPLQPLLPQQTTFRQGQDSPIPRSITSVLAHPSPNLQVLGSLTPFTNYPLEPVPAKPQSKPRFTSLGDKYLMFGMLDMERQPELSKLRGLIKRIANQEHVGKDEIRDVFLNEDEQVEQNEEIGGWDEVREGEEFEEDEEGGEIPAKEIQLKL